MGASLDLDIFLKKEALSLKQLFLLLEEEGWHITLLDMFTFDVWHFTNQTPIDPPSLEIEDDLLLKKFMFIDFTVNDTWHGGVGTSFEENQLELSFWIDTNDLQPPETTSYDPYTYAAPLYEHIADFIDRKIEQTSLKDRFLAASIGVETSVEWQHNIATTLQYEYNSSRWLVSNSVARDIALDSFQKEVKSNITYLKRRNNEY